MLRYLKTKNGTLDLFFLLFFIGIPVLWMQLLDDKSQRLERLAERKGAFTERAITNSKDFPIALPKFGLTSFLRPVIKADFSCCDLVDKDVYWICRWSDELEVLDIRNNSQVTNASVVELNKLVNLRNLAVSGTKIDPSQLTVPAAKRAPRKSYFVVPIFVVLILSLILYAFRTIRSPESEECMTEPSAIFSSNLGE